MRTAAQLVETSITFYLLTQMKIPMSIKITLLTPERIGPVLSTLNPSEEAVEEIPTLFTAVMVTNITIPAGSGSKTCCPARI